MARRKIVLVLGAGASHELRMPLGSDLIHQISRTSFRAQTEYEKGDGHLLHWLGSILPDSTPRFYNIFGRIATGIRHAKSTDDYLDSNKDDKDLVLIVKALIGNVILSSEKNSNISYVDIIPTSSNTDSYMSLREKVEKTWIWKLFSTLFTQTDKSNIEDVFKNVSIINFNYDRTLKHYIKSAIEEYFHLDSSQAERIAQSLKQYHPYGTVGCLPWEPPHHQSVDFGQDLISTNRVIQVKGFPSLFTYTEKQTEAACDVGAMRSALQDAEIVMFLGMAYHPQNMDILFEDVSGCYAHFYGTTLGLPEIEALPIKNRLIRARGRSDIHFHTLNGTCSQALTEWGSLLRYQ